MDEMLMSNDIISRQEIFTLKQFYDLMAKTRDLRLQIVENIFNNRPLTSTCIDSLANAHASLANIPLEQKKRILVISGSKRITVDLTYEITELEKDIFYLENGEPAFIKYLEKIHSDFRMHLDIGAMKLKGMQFNCFMTDRDGTINNYCGRYRSSVQSVYNSVFIARFAKKRTACPIILTSAPLENFGIVDVSVSPEKTLIYAASKGREFIDLTGKRRYCHIDGQKQILLDKLNQRLSDLVKDPSFEKFSLIGSGLQLKFGQTTIARQNITNSISEDESDAFLKKIREIVFELDPKRKNFIIEDTGLDIEIILTIEVSQCGVKDFDKADAVKYLNSELNFDMTKGPHLVCGDTSSDIPMIKAFSDKTEDTWSIFVTKDNELAGKVKYICPNSIIVPEPDMLVAILSFLSI
ncbi:MAG: trehalose 6-phosphate synthase [Desulfobacterales bacterium]|uniref:Trehalose 6-phosphate synthase n=1 Tax=Candidatus Desulfaltia bathyphila TaxID=2841697 RepID=A0A8J6N583_9BACT|nr:trehalose 6-phosphate synthase [Candidatus Desulfaltia bathyphila]MBL7194716.1 trehalose 6-phosphate synthase [Desulfobacterales bacterium]MBL7207316.1 trehalose 6-phosphate synthase [Desulfobacterales bacterium]